MHHDRGSIKWTSLMLPEHVEMLREWKKEDDQQIKPQLDPQQTEHLHYLLQSAMDQQTSVTLRIFSGHKITEVQGVPLDVSPLQETIKLKQEDSNDWINVYFSSIVDIR